MHVSSVIYFNGIALAVKLMHKCFQDQGLVYDKVQEVNVTNRTAGRGAQAILP